MKKMVLWGYYGYNNFGDDLMLYNIVNYLDNKVEIEILTVNKSITDIKETQNVKLVETFRNNKLKNLLQFVKCLKNSDFLVWGGGTCFSEEDGVVSPIQLGLAKLLGVKVIFMGVGISPIKDSAMKKKMKLVARLTDKIYVRDIKSYKYAREYFHESKVNLTEDLAYLFSYETNSPTKCNAVTVSLRDLSNYLTETEAQKVYDTILKFVSSKFKCGCFNKLNVVALDSTNDVTVNVSFYNNLVKQLPEGVSSNLYTKISMTDKIKLLSESELNITGRLHGAFVSELSNSKTIAINYSEKVKSFMDSVGSSGCVNIKDVLGDKVKLDQVYIKLDPKHEAYLIKECRAKAVSNFDFLEGK